MEGRKSESNVSLGVVGIFGRAVNDVMRKVVAMEGGASEEKEVPIGESAPQKDRHGSNISCSSSSSCLGF
jgi:hypothetical protein